MRFLATMDGYNEQTGPSTGYRSMGSNFITHDGDKSYYNMTTVGSANIPSPQNPMNHPTPSFMKVFDLDLVGNNPQEVPDRFQKGVHPEWLYSYGTYQFVESQGSANSNKSIAYWDMYCNQPYFNGRGFLFNAA